MTEDFDFILNPELIIDPDEAALLRSYRNDLIDQLCLCLKPYENKDGYIRMKLVLKIIRSKKLK